MKLNFWLVKFCGENISVDEIKKEPHFF